MRKGPPAGFLGRRLGAGPETSPNQNLQTTHLYDKGLIEKDPKTHGRSEKGDNLPDPRPPDVAKDHEVGLISTIPIYKEIGCRPHNEWWGLRPTL